jgi:hypothetical protein
MSALFDLLLDVDSMIKDGSDVGTFCSSSMHTSGSHDAVLQAGSHGMIMYMGGFRFSLSGNEPCLNLFLPGWTLDTRAKFLWAMMGIVLLGIVTEGISKLRSHLSKRLSGTIKRWTITLLHGLQALVGYILMLATMTFSLELLGCVIVGLVIGFALFYDDVDDDLHVTNNPVRRISSPFFHTHRELSLTSLHSINFHQCCNFIQNEVNERASALRRRNLEDEEEAKDDDSMTNNPRLATTRCSDEDETRVQLSTETL